jgi:hypothetical protein
MTEDLIKEWCEARAQYDYDNFPGGFPYYAVAYRLYHAGRALYAAAEVEPAEGIYSFNKWFEKPSAAHQALLDKTTATVRNHGTDLQSGYSEGYYLGKKLVKEREHDR